MQTHFGLSVPSGPKRFRLAAIVLLAVPAGVLLAMGIGEMIGGELSGVQHIPEAAVLLLLAAAAWWRARPAGIVLIAVSSLLFVLWLGWTAFLRDDEGDDSLLLMWIAGAAIFFLPPFAAGWLLLRSTASTRE